MSVAREPGPGRVTGSLPVRRTVMTAGLALVVPLVLGTVGRLVMAPRGEGQRPAAAAGHRAHGARKPTRHGKAAARVQIVERIVQPRRVAPKRPPLELPPANEIVREQPA